MLYVCFGTFVRGIIVNVILLVAAGVLFAFLNIFINSRFFGNNDVGRGGYR